MMMPPHAGEKCCSLIKFLEKNLQKKLPTNIPTRIVYTGSKLSSDLKNVKVPTPFEENCSDENCNKNYISESARRLDERMKDHNGRQSNSHLLKHSVEGGHDLALKNHFRIIGKRYKNNTRKRKIVEDLLIKKMKPSL